MSFILSSWPTPFRLLSLPLTTTAGISRRSMHHACGHISWIYYYILEGPRPFITGQCAPVLWFNQRVLWATQDFQTAQIGYSHKWYTSLHIKYYKQAYHYEEGTWEEDIRFYSCDMESYILEHSVTDLGNALDWLMINSRRNTREKRFSSNTKKFLSKSPYTV